MDGTSYAIAIYYICTYACLCVAVYFDRGSNQRVEPTMRSGRGCQNSMLSGSNKTRSQAIARSSARKTRGIRRARDGRGRRAAVGGRTHRTRRKRRRRAGLPTRTTVQTLAQTISAVSQPHLLARAALAALSEAVPVPVL
jgi:hypothetical protein